ncbi:MAG: phosphotransferase [Actinomycetota bacterium]|nr:phosphotransferase [Actinomycetota bacterium]
MDAIEWVAAEQQKVELLVAPVLASGTYPSAVTLVRAGAGGSGGLFYRLAGGYERALFDIVRTDAAARVVQLVRDRLAPWRDGAPVENATIDRVRSVLVEIDDVPENQRDALAADEGIEVAMRRSTTHCDLHVFNVLVSDDEDAMVIDFAAVAQGPASVDPVALELSIIFHPDARDVCGDWPSVEQAENWDDFDRYVDGCPAPAFAEACRRWAFEVAAGDREVFASLYAYAARQLKFEDTRHEIAHALLSCARRRLGA